MRSTREETLAGLATSEQSQAQGIARPVVAWKTISPLSGDKIFEYILVLFATITVASVVTIAVELWRGSNLARHAFGFGYVTSQNWDPVKGLYGAGPYIFGTLFTSAVALLLAGPIGIGTSIFLTELAPRSVKTVISFLVEMLAAIPSVIYGLWAIFILVPIVRNDVEPKLGSWLGFLPFFKGPPYGVGLLSASLVLAIMILPTITAISRAVLERAPSDQKLAAYGLGATRWEVITNVSLPSARSGIIGALILGLGRALGETMAVTMVIGNRGGISWSLFSLGDTMASVIANNFGEASDNLFRSALIEIGLVLFCVTVLLNLGARFLVTRIGRLPSGAR